MTAPAVNAPMTQLPHVQSGNLATDLSRAGGSFLQGLQEERARTRQEALANAMLKWRQTEAEANLARYNQPQPGTLSHVVVSTPMGLRHGVLNEQMNRIELSSLGDAEAPAPETQYMYPTEGGGVGALPRTVRPSAPAPGTGVQTPQAPSAMPANMAPGTKPRDVAPTILTAEGQNGPAIYRAPRRGGVATPVVTAGTPATDGQPAQPGTSLQPRPQHFEVEKAQFAANMSRAGHGMNHIAETNPQVVDEVVTRLNSQAIVGALPVVGASAAEVLRSAQAIGLSLEAAKYLAHLYTFIGFAVPELVGKQMTIVEMRQQLAMFVPLLGEPEEARAIKRGNIEFRVRSAMAASGTGWNRIMADSASAAGIPQEFGGTLMDPTPPKPSRYGYTRP